MFTEQVNKVNVTIILMPSWEEIARRFNLRGDPIQNLTSLRKLYDLFDEAAEELQHLPNVYVIRKEIDDFILEQLLTGFFTLIRKKK